ncbi:HEAT repeat domain-containing protein [bacterium]|nr:HEAT repeat domain-containing protein [bacterium]
MIDEKQFYELMESEKITQKTTELKVLLSSDKLDEKYVMPLIKGLSDSDWLVRKLSADTLIKSLLSNSVASLRQLLDSNNVDERYWSLKLIGLANDLESEAKLTELAENDTDIEIRVFAAMSLARMGKIHGIKKLFSFLANQSWNIRNKAAYSLKKLGKQCLPYLISGLQSNHRDISFWCYQILRDLELDDNGYYIKLLDHENPKVRTMICKLLGGKPDPGILKLLFKKLCDQNWVVRNEAKSAIVRIIGDRYIQFRNELLTIIKSGNQDFKYWGVRILVNIGEKAFNDLFALLTSEDIYIKNFASKYIGKTKNVKAIDQLFLNLGDTNMEVRESAFESLLYYDAETLDKYIQEYLNHANDDIAWNITNLIGELGGEKYKFLIKYLKDGTDQQRLWSSFALRHFNYSDVLLELIKCLKDEYWPVRETAYYSLIHMKEFAADELLQNLRNENSDIVFWSKKALLNQIPMVTNRICFHLSKGNEDMRFFAADAAKNLRIEGAIPDLLNSLMDGNEWVRKLALEAILIMGKLDEIEKIKDKFPPGLKKDMEKLILEHRGVDINPQIERMRFADEEGKKEILKELLELGDVILDDLQKILMDETDEQMNIWLRRLIRAIETGSEFGLMF